MVRNAFFSSVSRIPTGARSPRLSPESTVVPKSRFTAAGSCPSGHINPRAIDSMRELGYDITLQRSKSLAEIPDVEYDFVATMGCGDECPFVRAKARADWNIPDPKNLPPDDYRAVRKLIEDKVTTLLADLRK